MVQNGLLDTRGGDIFRYQRRRAAVGGQSLGGDRTDAHTDRTLWDGTKGFQKEVHPAGTGKYKIVTLLDL